MLKLTIPLPMSVNHIYGRDRFKNTYLKPEGKKYKDKVSKIIKDEVEIQGWRKLEKGEYCFLDEVVYMNKAGRDADNTKKLLLDSINKSEVVWTDDTFCLPRTNRVYIDKDNPRIELEISPTGTVGIFENIKQFKEFEEVCLNCKRNKRNCSIKRQALENRIQPDVVRENGMWKCLKTKQREAHKR